MTSRPLRFYRIALREEDGISASFEFSTSLRDCASIRRKARKNGLVAEAPERIDVVRTREGILRALRFVGSHADNG